MTTEIGAWSASFLKSAVTSRVTLGTPQGFSTPVTVTLTVRTVASFAGVIPIDRGGTP
jgi:hypothetical protein